jgi:hypothetical protein
LRCDSWNVAKRCFGGGIERAMANSPALCFKLCRHPSLAVSSGSKGGYRAISWLTSRHCRPLCAVATSSRRAMQRSRALRHAVLRRKSSLGTTSETGSRFVERLSAFSQPHDRREEMPSNISVTVIKWRSMNSQSLHYSTLATYNSKPHNYLSGHERVFRLG